MIPFDVYIKIFTIYISYIISIDRKFHTPKMFIHNS